LRIVVRDGLTVCDTFRDPVFEIPIDLMFVFYCGSVLLIFLFYTLTQLRLSLSPADDWLRCTAATPQNWPCSLRRCGKRPNPYAAVHDSDSTASERFLPYDFCSLGQR